MVDDEYNNNEDVDFDPDPVYLEDDVDQAKPCDPARG